MNKMLHQISLEDFDYHLDKDRIAFYPTEKRTDSRLLYYNGNEDKIHHKKFEDIIDLIPPNSLLILNKTKVIQARMHFKKPSGGLVELLLVEPVFPSNDPVITLANRKNCIWECIIGGRKVNEGMVLTCDLPNLSLKAEVISREINTGKIGFSWEDDRTFSEIIDAFGSMPLPPYISREAGDEDKIRYQTVFAKEDGSIAAPTAGLHFTHEILKKLAENGVKESELTLHVGPGTFLPVESNDITEHKMHSEQIYVSLDTIQSIIEVLKSGNKLICVGTTSLRTIESLYWYGLKMLRNVGSKFNIDVEQWEPYQDHDELTPLVVMEKIKEYMVGMKIDRISGRTRILIVPGYQFKLVNGLITNFHLPKSTLILLVASFIGKNQWKKIYDEALKEKYRFLSYGDSNFLLL